MAKRRGAPEGNVNAIVWTVERSKSLLEKALELSESEEYDFIGEIAKKLKVSHSVFDYAAGKYPELKDIHSQILTNLEANCYKNAKKGKIREATAIINLKSNYKWKDRQDLTTGDKPINDNLDYSKLTESELAQLAEISRKLRD